MRGGGKVEELRQGGGSKDGVGRREEGQGGVSRTADSVQDKWS